MDPAEVEDAYLDLAARVEEERDESAFQECFEQHAVLWECLDYAHAIPKPRLRLSERESIYPDFAAVTPESTWEVVDLKLPFQPIIKEERHRNSFYSEIHNGIAQIRDYREYFDDAEHRRWFSEHHGFEIAKDPRGLLIVGGIRPLDFDKTERDRIIDDAGLTTILTYDDVLNRLVQAQGQASGLRSVVAAETWAVNLSIQNVAVGRENYLVDQRSPAGDRMSFFFDERGQLTVRVIDANGVEFVTKAVEQVPLRTWTTLAFVFATSHQHAVLQLAVDGRTVAIQRWPSRIAVSQSLSERLDSGTAILGNSIAGGEGTQMMLSGYAAWAQPLPFLDLLELNEAWRG